MGMGRKLLVGLVGAGLALAGCGDADEPSVTTTGAPDPRTSLTITVDEGNGSMQEWTLSCDPTGGTHPEPDAACEVIATLGDEAFAPVPPDQGCTMIYGGPQTATVAGARDGQIVDASYSRQNGCEIARWDAVVDLLVEAGGA